eukprot:scaffold13700_cov136-Isochrysis_galbana.AAC.4
MHGCGGWLGLVLYIGPGWGYGGGPRRGVGRCGLPLTRGRGGPSCYSRSPISCPWSGFHCDPTPTETLDLVIWGFSEVLVLRARKVGVGSSNQGQGQGTQACFKVVFKAHPTVYGWLIGSRVGVSSVGLKRARSADPVEEMAAGALRGLAPQDDAGRETPERKGLRKSQVEGLCLKRFAQVQGIGGSRRALGGRGWTYLIVVGCLRDGCLAGPSIEPPSAAVRVGERCHPLVGTRHVRKPHRVFSFLHVHSASPLRKDKDCTTQQQQHQHTPTNETPARARKATRSAGISLPHQRRRPYAAREGNVPVPVRNRCEEFGERASWAAPPSRAAYLRGARKATAHRLRCRASARLAAGPARFLHVRTVLIALSRRGPVGAVLAVVGAARRLHSLVRGSLALRNGREVGGALGMVPDPLVGAPLLGPLASRLAPAV